MKHRDDEWMVEEWRGKMTVDKFIDTILEESQREVAREVWKDSAATEKQIKYIQELAYKNNYSLIRHDFSIVEASMLIHWLKDVENLAIKPYYELSYVNPKSKKIKKERRRS